MYFIKDKINIMTKKLEDRICKSSEKKAFEYVACNEYKSTNQPPESGWMPFADGMRFEGRDTHYWVHFKIDALPYEPDTEHRMRVKTGREGQWSALNPQCTVYFNGKTVQALDTNHTWIPLEDNAEYDVYIYVYTGMGDSRFDFEVNIDTVDLKTEALYYDIKVPYDCMMLFDENDENHVIIRDCLDKSLLLLDLRDFYSVEYYQSLDAAREYLKNEFYTKECGKTKDTISAIGHTHIDVAWLWTVRQTREKAQRSFSTAIALMKRYKDFVFMSSQPQLYQYVKESDPELYRNIKQYVKSGQWEAEGAMWLEADTNLISGESLVRQILYGKRFMKDEFGADNKILWLPDVFGYSGALPQILQKSGVTQFFTTKMAWNETNTMPNDSFVWEGIDGSRVFASFVNDYTRDFTPDKLKEVRDVYKNKSYTQKALMTFGFGDGGGGPTYKMMENYRRLKYGIPGMPKPVTEKAGEFFDTAEKEFLHSSGELRNMPVWKGEMYFEFHRGTYTSMAKNKKFNRMSELLYQKAETLAITDTIFTNAAYPTETLRKNHINILLNQFHDIIPGSSVKEVYDVTDAEYQNILSDGTAIVQSAVDSIVSKLNTDGGIFVYNPSPFEISDYVSTNGKLYYARNVPPHGWKVIEDKPVEYDVFVSDSVIENDVVRVSFNEKYHITSVYDKSENREIIADGTEANVIEIFEDYPKAYDAWEISDYYRQKMWIADDVSEVTLLANGIRIKRKYQKSEIVQDIILKKGSKRIDFVTTVDWHEDHELMKAAFPVDIHNTFATYDIQFGNVTRPTHQNTGWDRAKFEVCAHKWADLSENGYGVSILNDCKYGYSVSRNVMEITLLKSATNPNAEADRGINIFTYSLYPHMGNYIEGKTVKEGYHLNMPFGARIVPKTNGNIPDIYSIISGSNESVVIETIKKAEDDNSIIARMYETYNGKAETEIQTAFEFKEVYLCDLLENNIKLLEHEDNKVKIKLSNFEIVTVKFVL